LVFHLLFMGRHPYAGVYRGRGEMPLERAIAEHRFAYGPGAARAEMGPPPGTLRLEAVTPPVAEMFGRAFGPAGSLPCGRPTAAAWKAGLDGLLAGGLDRCRSDIGHAYPKQLRACPWCHLMALGAPNYFVTVALSRGQGAAAPAARLNVAELWGRIESYALPRRAYRRPVVPVPPPPPLPPVPPGPFEPPPGAP